MARNNIDLPVKDRTTIITSKTLLDRLSIHLSKTHENQSDFITRALINQLEKEGDFSIRQILEEEERGNI